MLVGLETPNTDRNLQNRKGFRRLRNLPELAITFFVRGDVTKQKGEYNDFFRYYAILVANL
jgi:hypothetical protein